MNNTAARLPIIGVFGSKKHTIKAAEIGRAAAEKFVLLTGGDGQGTTTVKDCAIRGAREKQAHWIGVLKEGKIGNPSEPEGKPKDSGFLVWSGLGHRRNYLEACICDAAIALKDGPGTGSEVISCLFLAKAVVLYGDWSNWNLEDAIESSITLWEEDRVSAVHNLNGLIEDLQKKETLDRIKRDYAKLVWRFPEKCDPIIVIEKVLTFLGEERVGEFPTFLGDKYSHLENKYRKFLGTDGISLKPST